MICDGVIVVIVEVVIVTSVLAGAAVIVVTGAYVEITVGWNTKARLYAVEGTRFFDSGPYLVV